MQRRAWADPASIRPRARYLGQLLLLAALYYASGRLSFSLSVSHRIVTIVVFAAEGFSLAALIGLGPRLWPGVFLGQLLLALGTGLSWPLATAIAVINSAEAVLGAQLFRRWQLRPGLKRVRDVAGLLLLVALVLQPFSATLGNLVLWAGGVVPTAELGYSWLSWWAGNGLGQMLLVPFLLSFCKTDAVTTPTRRLSPLTLLLLLPVAWLILPASPSVGVSLAFALTMPVLALLAAWQGVRAVSLAVALLSFVALTSTRLGNGPFVVAGEARLMDLNVFLLCIALTALFIAALFAERKSTERELTVSEGRLRSIIEHEPECVQVMGPTGELLELNAAGLAMLQATSLQQVQARSFAGFIAGEHRAAFVSLHRRVMGGESGIVKFRVTGLHGRQRWLRTHAIPLRDAEGQVAALLGITQDVTEHDEAERRRGELQAQLTASEKQYRTLVSDLQIGVLIQSSTTQVMLSNRKALELLGVSEAQLLGKSSFDPDWNIVREDGAPFPGDALPVPVAIATGQPVRNVVMGVYRPASRDRVWLMVDAFPVFESDAVLQHVVCTFSDITQVRLATLARDELEGQLRESQKMEAIGTLAGGIAHDLNNALAIILGNVEMARLDTPGDSGAHESLAEIQMAGTRARDMVRQILAFSRRQPSQRAPLHLAPVLREAARLLRATVPARIALDVHCALALPPVLANATQVQQALINLVTNAMQAIGGGGGRIGLRLDALALDAALLAAVPALRGLRETHPGRVLRLAVSDTGLGMDAAVRGRIFEPFYTTKPVGEGTGLGLAVVHGIVQGHDGVITVDSEPGAGSTFTIYLPVADEVAGLAADCADAAPASARPGGSADAHVLYVDDDAALVSLVKRLLERQGYRVSAFTDAAAALLTLRGDPQDYALLLTDYNMPGRSGLDLAREALAIRSDLPVAVISGFIDEPLRAQALEAGVVHLIYKADTIEEIGAAVTRLLEREAAMTTLAPGAA